MATKQQAAYIRELEAKIPKFLDMLNVGGFDLWEHCTPEVFTTFHGMFQLMDMTLTQPIYVLGRRWWLLSMASEKNGSLFSDITRRLDVQADDLLLVTRTVIIKRYGKQTAEHAEKLYLELYKVLDDAQSLKNEQQELDRRLSAFEQDARLHRAV